MRIVGRLVLDGALDPALSAQDLSRGQLGGFDLALNAFLADCIKRSDCPVGRTMSAGLAHIAALIGGADTHPVRASSGRVVTQSLVVLGVLPGRDRGDG